jgi:MFS family permease
MGQLSGSIYLNHVAIYAIEAPAYAASGFLIDRVGRRPILVYALAECEAPASCGCAPVCQLLELTAAAMRTCTL